ncbi:MAG: penicillin-binding protein [Oscillospiraceae bacterium]|nr:penicillin-binding protein [Oscillospiraceae bacterium]
MKLPNLDDVKNFKLPEKKNPASSRPESSGRKAGNPSPVKKKKKKRRTPWILRALRSLGTVILTTFLSFVLFFCVTGIICAIAATTYVINYMESTNTVTIQEMTMSYSTHIYARKPENAEGEYSVIYTVDNEVQRIPVKIEEIPQHVRNAFVYAEDERFYSHEGVDYKRTAASFANMILNFWNTDQGGSTITQQLIKNLTGDNEVSPQRKIREIFRSMQLEKSYTKDEILCTYLNYIGFGGSANGVEMAANKYFGKHVWELSIAEAACLAAIPQNPEVINPFAGKYDEAYNEVTGTYYLTDNFINTGRELNRTRMEYILFQMYDNGAITYDEYQQALTEKLIFTDSEEYKRLHPEEFPEYAEGNEEEGEEEEGNSEAGAQLKPVEEEDTTDTSWVIDEALREFAGYLMEEKGVSYSRALQLINTGGYQIYTTVDWEMQEYVEKKFSDVNNLLKGMTTGKATTYYRDLDGDGVCTDEENLALQCGFTAIDYSGNILCTVGRVGGHPSPLCVSFASTEPQQPGSAIKPVTTYGYALENDFISYATHVLDYPPLVNAETGKPWPTNYSNDNDKVVYTNQKVTVENAIEVSRNTIPALLCKTYGNQNIFMFARDVLGMKLDEEHDIGYAPLAVGALEYGVTVTDLVNAYMVYGNGGFFSDAHIISSVKSADGNLIYAGGDDYAQAISPETSYVMNKLLQNVVEGDSGTGKRAKITSKGKRVPIGGKTGTSSDWFDKLFVGLNPDFVSGIWVGYPENKKIKNYGAIDTGAIWKNIIGGWISEHYSGASFPDCDSVITGSYCASTGKIAGAGCAKGGTGYWKSTFAPYCDNRELGLRKPEAEE